MARQRKTGLVARKTSSAPAWNAYIRRHDESEDRDAMHKVNDLTLTNLDARSREIFRLIVDNYMREGEPLGSRKALLLLKQRHRGRSNFLF